MKALFRAIFRSDFMKNFGWLSVLVIALTASLGALYIDRTFFRNGNQAYVPPAEQQKETLGKYSQDSLPAFGANVNFVAATRRVRNAVVYIRSSFSESPKSLKELHQGVPDFGDLFEGNGGPREGGGSGVILTPDGLIVTNYHVIEGANKLEVVLHNKQSYQARVVGKDPSTDLALLKIEASGLPVIQYGNSDQLEAGEWVLAIGNPFDLTSTVTAGIISGKGRSINIIRERSNLAIESFIQTDAAVNPGNSGGALVNLRGELVGINTAIASPTGSYSGYSFAVPVNLVQKVVQDLREFGKVQRGLLGVSVADVDATMATKLGLEQIEGVYVREVSEGSAAEVSGIKKGDIILSINGRGVNSVPELQESVGRFRPGEKIKSLVLRGKNKMEISLTLKSVNGSTKLASAIPEVRIPELGVTLSMADPEMLKKAGVQNGLKIEALENGPLEAAGLEEGFTLFKLDKQTFSTVVEFERIYKRGKGGMLVEALNAQGSREYFVLLKPASR